jgi:hypothetical protein
MSPAWLKISEKYSDNELLEAAHDLTYVLQTPLLNSIHNDLQSPIDDVPRFIAQALADRLKFYKRNN